MAKPTGKLKNGNKDLAAKAKKPFVAKVPGPKPLTYEPKAKRFSHEDEISEILKESCHELGRLVAGQEGQYGLQDETGILILFLTINWRGRAILHVNQSTVHGIVPSDNWHIPLSALHYEELDEGVTTGELLEWQKKVHAFVRKHIQPFFATRVPGLAEKMADAVETPVAPVKIPVAKTAVVKETVIDMTGAKPMVDAAAFLGVKKDTSVLFFHQEGNVLAFFRAEVIAGNQVLTLVHAEQGHSMFRALVDHQKVVVHLVTLKNQTGPYSDDLSQIKAARECVRQFLRAIAQSFGLKPRQQHGEESVENDLKQQVS